MKTIPKEKRIYSFDKNHTPVETIESGETICFESCDCFTDTIQSENDRLTDLDFTKVNPASGPVYIEGALPGDVLKVEILKIDVDPQAIMIVAQGAGLLGECVKDDQTKIFPIQENSIEMFGLKLPLTKMIGVIGTAPAGEAVENGTPGEHGGNMDCTVIKEGSTLFLPVEVEGALLAIGDFHAAMGDGEISVSGAEVSGRVKVRVTVLKESIFPTPSVLTDNLFATISSSETMQEASKLASEKMTNFLTSMTELTFNEAYMLLSATGKLSVCQVVNPLKTMRMEIGLTQLDTLIGKTWR